MDNLRNDHGFDTVGAIELLAKQKRYPVFSR